MFERLTCVFISFLSLTSIFFSTQRIQTIDDKDVATRSNYLDVSFTNVKSQNGTEVSITEDHQNIVMDQVVFHNVGEEEIIEYELWNNSASYDVDVVVLVNNQKEYQDDTFRITTSNIGELKRGEKKIGTIIIKYENEPEEEKELPFKINLQIKQKKGYLA